MYVLYTSRRGKIVHTPSIANFTLTHGEFNKYYMRAVSVYAIQQNKKVKIYREKIFVMNVIILEC